MTIVVDGNAQMAMRAADFSRTQVGVREVGGNNRGPEIRRYLASVHLPEGLAYCMAGIVYSFDMIRGSEELPILRTGSTSSQWHWCMQNGRVMDFTCRRGDIITWRTGNGIQGHVEQIDSVISKAWVITTGYNTSSGTGISRDGGGVYRRRRCTAHIMGRLTLRGTIRVDQKARITRPQ